MKETICVLILCSLFANCLTARDWYFSKVNKSGIQITYNKSHKTRTFQFLKLPNKYKNLFLPRDFTDHKSGKTYECCQLRFISKRFILIYNAFAKEKKDVISTILVEDLDDNTKQLLGYK